MNLVRQRSSTRQGLTLIELIVVLMILIALGGLLIPVLPGMLTRSHNATCVTNIAETSKAIITYQTLNNAYPNNWDALSDGTNGIDYLANGTSFPAKFGGPGTAATMAGGQITFSNLNTAAPTNELAALSNAGITTVQLMVQTGTVTPGNGNGFDPTFNNYVSATPTPQLISGTTKLAFLDPANPAALLRLQQLNLPTTARYVILGVGPRSDLVGKGILSAPVHFGDIPVLNPEFGYERLVAIFKVSDTAVNGGAGFTTAVFVGAAPVHDNGLGNIDDELQNYYQLQNGGS